MHDASLSRFRHAYLRGPWPHAIAHRGGAEVGQGDVWAENTLSAFQAAYDTGFRIMETDVHLTSDGVVVAFHDDDLGRVTDTQGTIGDFSWNQLKNVVVAGCERIPAMADLLATFDDVRFNIDPKNDDVVDALGDVLEAADALDRVCVGAFADSRLATLRARFGTELCCGAGPGKVLEWVGAVQGSNPMPIDVDLFQVPPSFDGVELVTQRSVTMAHEHEIAVHVWTIDDPHEMNRLLDLGVDGIMTDRPGVLRDVLVTRSVWA